MSNKGPVAYYRVDLVLDSALSIGAADSIQTDNDVVRDGRGLPLIPATSLAGVFRSYFDEADARVFFGRLVEDGGDLTESIVRVYDATWVSEDDASGKRSNRSISVRDGVGLEQDNKVVDTGLKFDRQVVERGAAFRTYLEITDCSATSCDGRPILACVEDMLGALDSGALSVGGKTSRGMGKVCITACKRACFDLCDKEDLNRWLDFDPFVGASWKSAEDVELLPSSKSDILIVLDLAQRGAVSVREYSTEPRRPDFSQFYIRDTSNDGLACDVPVIPGTSWAGAFRSRYRNIADEKRTRDLFGDVWRDESDGGKTKTRRSRIEFSETELRGGGWKEITRNSIDRFTGGTKDHALFKLRTYYAGTTQLRIRIRCKGESWDRQSFEALVACIADLHNGLLVVGGLTAVGHGLFRITDAACTVGGSPLSQLDFKAALIGDGDFATPDIADLAERLTCAVADILERGDAA